MVRRVVVMMDEVSSQRFRNRYSVGGKPTVTFAYGATSSGNESFVFCGSL